MSGCLFKDIKTDRCLCGRIDTNDDKDYRDQRNASGGAKTRKDPIKGNFGQRCHVARQGGAMVVGAGAAIEKTEWNLNLFSHRTTHQATQGALSSFSSDLLISLAIVLCVFCTSPIIDRASAYLSQG